MDLTTSIARHRYLRKIGIRIIVAAAAALTCVAPAALAAPPVVATCGVDHAQTAAVRSSSHFTAVLKMHSEDDHGKETHLCESEYTLQITRPDGSSMQPFEFGASDDVWDRPLVFRIDGFSQDGKEAFVFIAEGAYPQLVEAVEFDMSSGKPISDIFIGRRFTSRLGRECASTLHIAGTSTDGRMILGSDARKCSQATYWELSPNKTTERTGGRVLPESPKIFRSTVQLRRLDAGTRADF